MLSFNGSRNEYNKELKSEESLEFFNKLFNLSLKSIPDGDTLSYFWNTIDYKDIEKIRYKMVNKLIRSRQLEEYRYNYRYLIAIDGTEQYRFKEKHCENCLYEKRNGELQYFHRVLEAKIVTENCLSISIATEFIENPENEKFDKQDCELKAFYRLEDKLKKLFPKLKIVLLLDGLYPNSSVFKICEKNNWKYIITLKEGNLKTVWEDFNGLFRNTEKANGQKIELPEKQDGLFLYRWQNELEYSNFNLSILAVYKENLLIRGFISNFKLNNENIVRFDKIARLRWKIENQGFDVQKNHSNYNLEHLYTKNTSGIKVIYLLIQISHLINQLFLKADVLRVCYDKISQKFALSKVLSGIKLGWINEFEEAFSILKNKKFQMRFNSS